MVSTKKFLTWRFFAIIMTAAEKNMTGFDVSTDLIFSLTYIEVNVHSTVLASDYIRVEEAVINSSSSRLLVIALT